MGTIAWSQQNGQVYAVNTDPATPVNLLYLKQNMQGTSPTILSSTVTIDPNNGFSTETADLQDFIGGTINFNPIATSTEDTLTRAFSFAIVAVSAASSINIMGGVNASFQKTANGWNFTLASTGPKLSTANATVVDQSGNRATVKLNFNNGSRGLGDDSVTVPLPMGLDLSNMVELLEIDLQVEQTSFDAFIKEGRRGRPGSELPEAVRRRLGTN
ncbi:MAG TPA: hypothetical protein VGB59_10435 [Allosphingosinicella sp.]|jgi:hypothetical protein